eukprot:gnl/Ergobibamus_cyprinoides/1865.p1 GENE.gnl/Ergobibamus_cyprinoides/1865~~gnl/Ergobibamus_cyprinoides/1865.p1  ORF type:complete len:166 (+),score=74.24 gnl/Ergobibamus_cyprinoides/1865:284-781(+)
MEGWSTGRILRAALTLMLFGTAVVCIFSDPMVDVISGLSGYLGVPAFYTSFIVTPLASNASELISSLMFASKKKVSNISLSLAALAGAAIMNASLVLGVFCVLVAFTGIPWAFSAEVICILAVTLAVGILGATRTTYPAWMALPILALYPVAIALVAILEHFGLQ